MLRFFEPAHEQVLIIGLRARDDSAFTTVFRTLRKPLIRHARRYVRPRDLAEDVVDDVFGKIWICPPIITGSLTGFFFSAVRYRALDVRQQEALRQRDAQTDPDTAPLAVQYDAESLICLDEVTAAFETVTSTLTDRAREVFVLSTQRELSIDDIAEVIGLSRNTVRVHLANSRRVMRRELTRRGLPWTPRRRPTGSHPHRARASRPRPHRPRPRSDEPPD